MSAFNALTWRDEAHALLEAHGAEVIWSSNAPWLPALERALNRLALLHRTLAPFVEASQEGRFDPEATRAMLKQLQSNLEAL